MKKTGCSYLLHPLFICALFVLGANDFFWKYHYHNWLTGKLSDVAGLLVLPLFLTAFFPKQKTGILLFSALFFCWWKSSLSEPVLLHFRLLSLPVHRVVDYTDLFALPVLLIAGNLKPFPLSFHRPMVQGLKGVLALLTVFALCATTMPYRSLFTVHPDSSAVSFHETFTQKRKADAVLQTLVVKDIPYRLDSVLYYPVQNQRNLYYRQPLNDSVVRWQKLPQAEDSTIYIRREIGPFYLIPGFSATIGNNTYALRNIRFTLSENQKRTKTHIRVETFESPGLSGGMNNQARNDFKILFREMFSGK